MSTPGPGHPTPEARVQRLGRWGIHSLRARLLVLLLGVVALAAGVQAALAYRSALAEADALFDYHMRQTALSLRAGMAPGVAPAPPLPQGAPEVLDYVVQVWSIDGLRLYDSDTLAALPERAVLGYSTVRTPGGARYRVFSVQTPTRVIQVAQDLAIRSRMARSLAWRTVAPIGLALPLLALALWWVVGRALRPVQRVRTQIATRRAEALDALDTRGLPDELAPLVTEFNALLARVRKAFAAQQAFVADAAHELRSPLAALRLQTQALQRAPDEASRQRATQRLLAGIDRAARLVDQLLALAREEAQADGEPGPTATTPVALDKLARTALADAAPDADTRGLTLSLGEAEPLAVPGQADALAIALRNLLDNALKYTPAGGQVQVSVLRLADGQACLRVDDSGPGIDAAERATALTRFKRLDGQAQPTAGGSGLGLAIVQAIAQRHGAELALGQAEPLGGLRAELRFR